MFAKYDDQRRPFPDERQATIHAEHIHNMDDLQVVGKRVEYRQQQHRRRRGVQGYYQQRREEREARRKIAKPPAPMTQTKKSSLRDIHSSRLPAKTIKERGNERGDMQEGRQSTHLYRRPNPKKSSRLRCNMRQSFKGTTTKSTWLTSASIIVPYRSRKGWQYHNGACLH